MKFSALSIKQKLILILLFAVLASTALISTVSQVYRPGSIGPERGTGAASQSGKTIR